MVKLLHLLHDFAALLLLSGQVESHRAQLSDQTTDFALVEIESGLSSFPATVAETRKNPADVLAEVVFSRLFPFLQGSTLLVFIAEGKRDFDDAVEAEMERTIALEEQLILSSLPGTVQEGTCRRF
jgi:hypothetical protein